MAEILAFKKRVAICNTFRSTRATSLVNLANWNTSPIFTNLWVSPDGAAPNISLPAVYGNEAATKSVRGRSFQTAAAKDDQMSFTQDTLLASQLNVMADKLVGQTHGTGTYPDGTSVPSGTAIPYETSSEPPIVDIVWDDGVNWYTAGFACSGFTLNFSHNSPVSLSSTWVAYNDPVLLTSLGSATKDNWAPDGAAGDGILGFKDIACSQSTAATLWSGSISFTNSINGRWNAGRATSLAKSNILYGNDLSATFSWNESASEDTKAIAGTEVAITVTAGNHIFGTTKLLIDSVDNPSELDQAVWSASGTSRNVEGSSDGAVISVSGIT